MHWPVFCLLAGRSAISSSYLCTSTCLRFRTRIKCLDSRDKNTFNTGPRFIQSNVVREWNALSGVNLYFVAANNPLRYNVRLCKTFTKATYSTRSCRVQ